MRRLVKFLHTMGSIGFMGSLAAVLVLAKWAPAPESLADYAYVRGVMAQIAAWLILPSLILTLVPGLLAIAVNRAFQDAGWAWIKAATGILIFAGGLHALAPIQEEARLSAQALAGTSDASALSGVSGGEVQALWVLLAVSVVNVVLGVWRPRILRASGRALPPRREGLRSWEQRR